MTHAMRAMAARLLCVSIWLAMTGSASPARAQDLVSAEVDFGVGGKGAVTLLAPLSAANEAPAGGVTGDPAGNLWGTSTAGGTACASSLNLAGCGTLFVVTSPPPS